MMKLKYKKDLGAQKLYDDILDVAKNMLVYPGEDMLRQKFLNEIPVAAVTHILEHLVPEIHLLENLVVEAKRWEEIERHQSIQTKLQSLNVSAPSTSRHSTETPSSSNQENNCSNCRDAPRYQSPRERSSCDNRKQFSGSSWQNRMGAGQPAAGGYKSGDRQHMAEQKLTRKTEPSNLPRQTEAKGHQHTTGNECHNCGKLGHYARDCPDRKVSFRAAHTAVPGGEDDCSVKSHPSHPGDITGEGAELADANGDGPYNPIDFEGAETQSFTWVSGDEDEGGEEYSDGQNYSMCEVRLVVNLPPSEPATTIGDIKVRRVVLKKMKHPRPRPAVSIADKACLLTYTEVNGHKAWTLWDSGSSASGITPAFAHIASATVFNLLHPYLVQLGMTGSRSSIQFGTECRLKVGRTDSVEYLDVANFDRYDMVIGTPYMHKHHVQLDFETNEVVVHGEHIPAQVVQKVDADQRVCRSRVTPRQGAPPQ
jgi:hypothetical protein